jgi:uncharacterized protein YpmS
MTNKKKGIKLAIAILISVIALCGIFLAFLFSDASYTLPNQKVSAALVDKIRQAQKQGSTIEVNKEELNEIISMYFKGEKSSGGLRIKGVSGDIVNGNIKLYIPASYKGINILISSEGVLSCKDNNVEYAPAYFKVGKITLPNSFVLNRVKSHLKQGMTIKNGDIFIDKSMSPLKIKSIKIDNDKVQIGIEKLSNTLEEKLKAVESKAKEISSSLKASVGNIAQGSQTTKTSETSKNAKTSSQASESSASSSTASQATPAMDAALGRVSSDLGSAMGSVSTAGQKAVISEMISAVNSMKGNANANPYEYAGSVRAIYEKLSPQEKAEVKSAIFSNVNGSDINILSKMLGK